MLATAICMTRFSTFSAGANGLELAVGADAAGAAGVLVLADVAADVGLAGAAGGVPSS